MAKLSIIRKLMGCAASRGRGAVGSGNCPLPQGPSKVTPPCLCGAPCGGFATPVAMAFPGASLLCCSELLQQQRVQLVFHCPPIYRLVGWPCLSVCQCSLSCLPTCMSVLSVCSVRPSIWRVGRLLCLSGCPTYVIRETLLRVVLIHRTSLAMSSKC